MEEIRQKVAKIQRNTQLLSANSLYLQIFVSNFKELQKAEIHFRSQIEELHDVLFRVPEVELATPNSMKLEVSQDQSLHTNARLALRAVHLNHKNKVETKTAGAKKSTHLPQPGNESLSLLGSEKNLERESVTSTMEIESATTSD
jgi:hypothetical protein